MSLSFSIIIPVYNTDLYLNKCLDTLVNQSYNDFEVILINDGSTDGSVKIIEKYISKTNNIKIELHRNPENLGCGGAKRKCIEISRGDYFAFLDTEDTIEPKAVELLLKHHLSGSDYSIVYSTHFLCDAKLVPQSVSTWPGKIPHGQSHLTSSGGHISAFALCKKYHYNKTSGIDPKFNVAEDQDLYLKMEETAPVLFVNKPLYYYRKHDHNMSWNDSKKINNLHWYYIASMDAYKRRKKQNTIAVNFTKVEADKYKLNYHLQLAKDTFNNKSFLKAAFHYFNASLKSYAIIFK